jgi:hypothetical protein
MTGTLSSVSVSVSGGMWVRLRMQAVETGKGVAASVASKEGSENKDVYGMQALTDRVKQLAGQITATADKKRQGNENNDKSKQSTS